MAKAKLLLLFYIELIYFGRVAAWLLNMLSLISLGRFCMKFGLFPWSNNIDIKWKFPYSPSKNMTITNDIIHMFYKDIGRSWTSTSFTILATVKAVLNRYINSIFFMDVKDSILVGDISCSIWKTISCTYRLSIAL